MSAQTDEQKPEKFDLCVCGHYYCQHVNYGFLAPCKAPNCMCGGYRFADAARRIDAERSEG